MYPWIDGEEVVMNSGCYGDDISKILQSITVIEKNSCKKGDKAQ